MTCDVIVGLVLAPCCERNSRGATDATSVAGLPIDGDPAAAGAPLNKVVTTMWVTVEDTDSMDEEGSK